MKAFGIIFSVFVLLGSCVKNNPDPAWLDLATWQLQANADLNGEEGELTLNFTDVYLMIDGEVIGFFELPIKLPILKEGSHRVTMYPAIRNNGISATKRVYPFVDPYEVTVNLAQNQTVSLQPVTQYNDACKFWIEDFEDASVKIYTEPSVSLGKLTAENLPQYLRWGNFYGHIAINATDTAWYGYTTPAMVLPQQGAEVFLEIDYQNNNSLLTGLLAYGAASTASNPNIQLNGQNAADMKWKKIYIDLKELVSYSTQANSFAHYFLAGLDAGNTQGDIYLDNIKVVHY